ncbi:MAG: DUF3422 domain-containing protein [Rhodocyclaceae bacterium]|nr:DUF3422 domain-containing protein [Rhodocyclaceae bacterium]
MNDPRSATSGAHTEHPLRYKLNNELHARPPVALRCPQAVSYVALVHDGATADDEVAHLRHLAEAFAVPLPEVDGDHLLLVTPRFRLKWERHTEFSCYTVFRDLNGDEGDQPTAVEVLPPRWLEAIPGKLLVGTHVDLRDAGAVTPESVIATATRDGSQMIATRVAEGGAWVFTDFLLTDGWTRFLVLDEKLTPRQTGRMVQRLLEIETYRMTALLAFPVAKEVGRLLNRAEGELADLMDRIVAAATPEDERQVLSRLTRLAADVERSVARSTFRFGAAAAYSRLVEHRIEELREVRVSGFTTIREFMDRRLAPAINTCAANARRQDDLSGRIARNSQLLRTRVDIELERQNQELLAQMNRRAKLQLRLQETVEGLSVVAITYYASQLVQYLAKGAKGIIAPLTPEIVTAVSIPVIGAAVAYSLHRMRKALAAADGGHD